MLSHKVLRVDVNREHGQIWKVSETRLKLRLEDLARLWMDHMLVGARCVRI